MHHTDPIEDSDIERLLAETSGPSVSIYLPTTPLTPDTDQDQIRLKNLRADAFAQLSAQGVRRPDADRILLPIDEVLDDEGFWPYLSDGLAIFCSPATQAMFRLPLAPEPVARVGPRFLLKPLLPLITEDGVFHILAISQNEARLFEGTRHHVGEIRPEDLPSTMVRALGQRGRQGARLPNRLWQGDEGQKDLYRKYFRQIDRALRPLLGHDGPPLVVAGVDYLLPIFREVSSHRQLIDGGIVGNPEHLSPAELHARAWPLVAPVLAEPRRHALETYRALAGTGRTSTDLPTIVVAALDGRVETLFLSLETSVFGRFDRDARTVTTHDEPAPGDVDLHAQAARLAYRTGAQVFAGESPEIPDGTSIAAVFRYA